MRADPMAAIRIPHLFRNPPSDAFLHRGDRHGVATLAVPATGLRPSDRDALARFRLTRRVEPSASDIHLVAGTSTVGEVLCHTVLRQPHQVATLPDLTASRVRTLDPLVTNERPEASRTQVARAMIEVAVALFVTMSHPLLSEVEALFGEVGEDLAEQTMGLLGLPHATMPPAGHGVPSPRFSPPRGGWRGTGISVFLLSDLSPAASRVSAIDLALDQPGKGAIREVLRLRQNAGQQSAVGSTPALLAR